MFFHEQSITSLPDSDQKEKVIDVGGKSIKLAFVDTSAQERFQPITATLLRTAHAIMLVFDITKPDTWNSIPTHLSSIQSSTVGPSLSLVLVGNKTDLESERHVDAEQAKDYGSQHDIDYLETSCKDGTGVRAAFEHLGSLLLKAQNSDDDDSEDDDDDE